MHATPPHGSRLSGACEVHQIEVGQSRQQQHIRRLTGETAAGDPVLHNVDGVRQNVEIARSGRARSQKLRHQSYNLLAQRVRYLAGEAVQGLYLLFGRSRHIMRFDPTPAPRRPTRSPLRLTAIVISAPNALHVDTGTG